MSGNCSQDHTVLAVIRRCIVQTRTFSTAGSSSHRREFIQKESVIPHISEGNSSIVLRPSKEERMCACAGMHFSALLGIECAPTRSQSFSVFGVTDENSFPIVHVLEISIDVQRNGLIQEKSDVSSVTYY
jgi:hypothetical protein